ncbi:MAG: peptidylprolyl isomerase [Deltaproteobacteria bacterium]|nr:peptidylprolyl isomerase [Deltaproteobacteria bacterium]
MVSLVVIFSLLSGQGFAAKQKKDTLAVLETDAGKIVLSFYPEDAPKTVKNFKKLIREGFYDGTYFHRVIPGFMIQGGDPNTKDHNRNNDGMGGPGYTIPAEFNAHHHVRGTLSMARRQDPNSAGSQFFICVARAAYLDGKYTVFGKVVEGMDVVDKIVQAPRDRRDNPLKPIHIQKAYLK